MLEQQQNQVMDDIADVKASNVKCTETASECNTTASANSLFCHSSNANHSKTRGTQKEVNGHECNGKTYLREVPNGDHTASPQHTINTKGSQKSMEDGSTTPTRTAITPNNQTCSIE